MAIPGDIKITWSSSTAMEMNGDFTVGDGDIVNENGLETAVIISLFTNRRANDDDALPDPTSVDKQGWWGDQASPDVENDRIGSRIWIFLDRAKTTPETLVQVKQAAEEALQWLIEDKVAVKVEVETERAGVPGNDRIHMLVKIYKTHGEVVAYEYDFNWEKQFE